MRKKIKKFPNYEIEEETGYVFSTKTKKRKAEFIIGGYSYVALFDKGIRKSCSIHRLKAIAFIPNPENKKCVNHKDSNRQNNATSNLEWVTYKENAQHASRNGRLKDRKGVNNINSKLSNEEVVAIKKRLKSGHGKVDIAKSYNVTTSTIHAIKIGKTWKHITIE